MMSNQHPYLARIADAVQRVVYPPLGLLKSMFWEAKQAQEDKRLSLEHEMAQQQRYATEALIALRSRHQKGKSQPQGYRSRVKPTGDTQ